MDFTKPEDNIAHLNLEEGHKVAIFGSGAGGHSFATARALNNSGLVYAVDVRKDMLEKMLADGRQEGFSNIKIVHANVEALGNAMHDHSVDAVVIPNTLFSYDEHLQVFKEANRILKPMGKVLVVDWRDSYAGMGPQAGNVIDEAKATSFATEAGFKVDESFNAGAQHYGVVFSKNL